MRELLIIMTVCFSVSAHAQVSAKNGRIRLMPPGWKSTAAFVTLKNEGKKNLEVVSAKADFAKKIELHTHKVEDGVMRMRQVDKMTVPANGELVLKPHGNHLMIFGLKSDLKEGSKQKIQLTFSNGKSAEVEFSVKKIEQKH